MPNIVCLLACLQQANQPFNEYGAIDNNNWSIILMIFSFPGQSFYARESFESDLRRWSASLAVFQPADTQIQGQSYFRQSLKKKKACIRT